MELCESLADSPDLLPQEDFSIQSYLNAQLSIVVFLYHVVWYADVCNR